MKEITNYTQILLIIVFIFGFSFVYAESNERDYGDLTFINPEEGEYDIQDVEAGDNFTVEWESNIYDTSWSISLHKFEENRTSENKAYGPEDYSGERVAEYGSVPEDETEIFLNIPIDLDPGYYYFNFGGKAAYDNSPAIKVVENPNYDKDEDDDSYEDDEHEDDDKNDDRGDHDLSKTEALQLFAAIFGKNSEIYQIISLLIDFGLLD